MKRSTLKRQLNKDISSASRSDFSKVMEKCKGEDKGERVAVLAHSGERAERSSIIKYLLGALAILLMIGAVVFMLLDKPTEQAPNAPASPISPPKTSGGYFVIDINPSIKISYNESGVVTGTEALNEDADVLLVNLSLEGKTPEEAIDAIFDKCIQLGYFSAERENNAVMASALTEGGERDEAMTEQVKKHFSNQFSKKKIRGVVITGVQNSALDEQAGKYGIDSQKYALILEYKELGGELAEDMYDDISISELYEGISQKAKERHEQIINEAKDSFKLTENMLFDSLKGEISKLINVVIIGDLENDIEEIFPSLPEAPATPNIPEKSENQPQGIPSMPRSISSESGTSSPSAILNACLVAIDEFRQAGDFIGAVNKTLETLEAIKLLDPSLSEDIDSSISKVNGLLEEFKGKKTELDSATASAQEKNDARLEAFKDNKGGAHEDVEKWQQDKEGELASSWYEYKKQWESERQNDLKNPPHK